MSIFRKITTKLQKDRPAMHAGPNSWHYRIYSWWLSHGGYWPAGIPEGLCHYARVVFIWAPWRWLWYVPLWKGIPAGGVLLVASALVAGVVAFFVAPMILIAGLVVIVVLGLFLVLMVIGETFETQLNRFCNWLFLARYRYFFIRPITLVALIALIISSFVFGAFNTVITLGIVIVVFTLYVITIGLFVVLVWGISQLVHKILSRRSNDGGGGGISTPSLAWEFVKAAKNRTLCPIMYLPGQEPSTNNPLNI